MQIKGTHLYSRWPYKQGGGAYIRNNILVGRWMGFKVGFYGIISIIIKYSHIIF